jgi:hypothetical protein
MEFVSLVAVYTVWTVLQVSSLCWCFLYVGMMRTELGVNIKLCVLYHIRLQLTPTQHKSLTYNIFHWPYIFCINSLQDYTYKTVQTVYTATKLTNSMYCNYNHWHSSHHFIINLSDHHPISTISMRKLVSRRVDHTGSQQFMNPLQITPHQLLAMKVSATEQNCVYCIIFQIKLHICYMLGRPVHNALPSILDSPIILYLINVLTLCKCDSRGSCQECRSHAHQQMPMPNAAVTQDTMYTEVQTGSYFVKVITSAQIQPYSWCKAKTWQGWKLW